MPRPPATPFHVMVKPIGPTCNLDCAYCYYLSKEELVHRRPGPADQGDPTARPVPRPRKISDEMLARFTRQYIEAHRGAPEIAFAWQGGEPTLMGADFFRRAVELQKQLAPPGVAVTNSIQTNGTLLDDEWGEFLAANRFLVGLSIDGPRDLHDAYRVDKGGRPSYAQVMAGLSVLRRHHVDFNALVVVNRLNARRPLDVYRFLRDDCGIQFMQFIPCVEPAGFATTAPQHWPAEALPRLGEPAARPGDSPDAASVVTPWSVDPDDFGAFLCAVFDEWLARDVGRVFVQTFDTALGLWMGMGSSLCVFAETCGTAVAMERDGTVYSCDHYVYPEFRLGNIADAPLAELVRGDRQRRFGQDKRDALPQYCRQCEVRFACNGECPKNRFIRTPDGEPGLNYLCSGLKRFFTHIDPWMKRMAAELRAGRPAANVMLERNASRRRKRAAAPRAERPAATPPNERPVASPSSERPLASSGARELPLAARGRPATAPNAPCPCGSGRKFKKCCGRIA